MEIRWDTPVDRFPGVGPARAEKLARLGITRAGDLLDYFPRGYEDRRAVSTLRDAPEDAPVCIRAMVALARQRALAQGRPPLLLAGRNAHSAFLSAAAYGGS